MKLLAAIAVPLLPCLALIPSASASHASAETCRGLPATLVSTSTGVSGTEGNDVIVAHGARAVLGRGGDDTICVLDSAPAASGPGVRVEAGQGNDVVDASGDTTAGVGAWQAETVVGSPGPDLVVLVENVVSAVNTGAGADKVEMALYLGRGTVDLGDDDDTFIQTYENTDDSGILTSRSRAAPPLTVAGGAGSDSSSVNPGVGRWKLDLPRGTWSGSEDGVVVGFSEFEEYGIGGGDPDTRVDVTGTSGVDDVSLSGENLGAVHLGRGADTILVYDAYSPPRVRGSVDGGKGEDTLMVYAYVRPRGPSAAVIDLASGTFGSTPGRLGRLRGIENVTAVTMGSLTLVGNRHANRLEWLGCQGGSVRGGAGDDEISYLSEVGGPSSTTPVGTFCKHVPKLRAYGGTGDDLLVGGPKADLLAGDRGRDRAIGGAGRDRCPGVERRTSC